MIISAFSSKWFLGFVVIGSLLGGVLGYVGSEIRQRKLDAGERVEVVHHYFPDVGYINGVEDTLFKNEYISFEMDTVYPKTLNFEGAVIRVDGRHYAIDFTADSSLVLIARQNDFARLADPSYMELWVWRKHVVFHE